MTALFGTSRSKVYSTVDADENNKDDVDEYLDEEDREVDSISRHPESLQSRERKCGMISCFCWSSVFVFVLYVAGTAMLLVSRSLNDPNSNADTSFEKMLLLPKFLKSIILQEEISNNQVIIAGSKTNGNEKNGIPSNMHLYDTNETITSIETTTKRVDDVDNDAAIINSLVISSNLTKIPDVAWIMSFGGSGTSYTIVNTETMTNVSTASNYGADYIPCISLDSRKNGPYVRSLDKGLPEKYVLTKTHCGGYCMDCPPGSYIHTLESFEASCRTGTKRRSTGRVVTTVYGADIPKRIVHLIRNPFDNIIGRMHLSSKHKISRKNDDTVDDDDNKCDDDAVCLKEWCQYLDKTYSKQEYDSKVFKPLYAKYHDVPCHAEWFRYIQWHNYAYQVYSDLHEDMPVHYLYYDNYTTNFDETVKKLFTFLEFPVEQVLQNDPYPFIASGKSYMKLFDLDHATAGMNMIHDLAVPSVWNLIKHYFDQYYVEYNQTILDKKQKDMDDDEEYDDDSSIVVNDNITSKTGNDKTELDHKSVSENTTSTNNQKAHSTNATVARNPQIVWLLSFPNSGESYTLTNLEQVTGTTTGTNYASETESSLLKPILGEKSPNGPFVRLADKTMPEYILSKTHCTAYCIDCIPLGYYVENVTQFTQGCATSLLKNETTGLYTNRSYYSTAIPTKAVHLIRNPFDNIVARLHNMLLNMKDQFTATQMDAFQNTKDGFDAWCEFLDSKYEAEEQKFPFFSREMKKMFKDLPCHSEWFRYIQWHNYVVSMIDDELDIPVYTMYYEDYSSGKYDETVDGLLQFLNMSRQYETIPYTSGHVYDTYYTSKDASNALKLVQMIAKPRTWKLVEHYFEE